MTPRIAKLDQYGLLQVAGEDARAFLHAQLTNDIENLAPGAARYAGWCSAKGRLLATFLVVPSPGGFLLQLSRDLAPLVAKRLSMFVLRSKVRITDASPQWLQLGKWEPADSSPLSVVEREGVITVRVGPDRALLLVPEDKSGKFKPDSPSEEWALAEIRAGRPQIAQATQDQFVPQMVNLELTGGVDFKKGCYPGQEIVARSQYRGTIKRRAFVASSDEALLPGQELFQHDDPAQPAGMVVLAGSWGIEHAALVELKIAAGDRQLHAKHADGPLVRLGALPYEFPVETT